MTLPTIKELSQLIKAVKAEIQSDDRAWEEDTIPGIQLTCAINDDGAWSHQTGDNSYCGSAYFYQHWAVVGVYRHSNARETAKEILSQWHELTEGKLGGFTVQYWARNGNWANPEGHNVKHVATKQEAKTLLQNWSETVGRYDDPRQASALVWYGSLDDVTDTCPDYELTIGPRLGVRWQPA